jgi:hypothetical protein
VRFRRVRLGLRSLRRHHARWKPRLPGDGHYAQKWIDFFGFGSPPTSAHYTGDAMGTCGTLDVMGIRYK